eukprot:jgi/Mesvir1/21004/Mv08062-RA.1
MLPRASQQALPRTGLAARTRPSIPAYNGFRAISASRPRHVEPVVIRRLSAQCVAAEPAAPATKYTKAVNPGKYGFDEVREEYIEEYKGNATLYRHRKTGAEVMSVCNDDENKVFGIVFRTPPSDSTGIPHILEHSVLCGSRKYPIKEPFVELMKGSLNTFLNAFTYPDRTCYPVASCNLQDFYNLVDVYLDAVLHPACVKDELTFQQEGWHYELEHPDDEITFKGVVFNEMKGVYSQPESILGREIQQRLSPNTTYRVDSGGDPRVIPSLTYEQFKEFHSKFYHPTNARIWFCGDDDPDTRLRILDSFLSEFDANPKAVQESEVATQPLFQEPRRYLEKYAVSEDSSTEKKGMITVNWLLADKPLDVQTEIELGVLNHLLLGTSAAPLRKALTDSGLGEAVVGGGVESELKQPAFSIGLKGVDEKDVGKVEELVMNVLKDLAEKGFDQESLDSSLNTIEFSLRENNTGRFPRGLSLMLTSMSHWLYGRDPFTPLKFEKPLREFKERLTTLGAKGVFSPVLSKFLLDNPHRVVVELQPDPALAAEEEAAEKARLAEFKAKLTRDELEQLVEATEKLKLKQETPDSPEALKCMPSLKVEDLPKEVKPIPSVVGETKGATTLVHDLSTNGILYADVALDLRVIPLRLLPLVPLFSRCLLETGTDKLSFVQLTNRIGRRTGGISASSFVSAVRGEPDAVGYLTLKGKAMAGAAGEMFEIMADILRNARMDDAERVKQMVLETKAGMESRMVGSGHSLAASRLDAMFTQGGYVGELMGGLSYYDHIIAMEQRIKNDWAGVQKDLEEIRSLLLSRKGAIVNLTADEATLTKAQAGVAAFLDTMPAQGGAVQSWQGRLDRVNEGLVVPTQVNYVGKAANLYEAGHALHGSWYVINKFLGTSWLWDRVRVSGGAYGGFSDFDSHSGVFTYLSYRDPNLMKTLDNYDGTAAFLRETELDKDTLQNAIIGCIGDIDGYQLPDAKGATAMMRYMLKVTEEERQRRRDEILGTSEKDFRSFADVLEVVRGDAARCVAVASAGDLEEANKKHSNMWKIRKVL